MRRTSRARGEDLDTCVHCVCGSHDVGEEDLLLCEELSDLGDGLGEAVVDEGDEVCLLSNCLLCDCLAAFDVVFHYAVVCFLL